MRINSFNNNSNPMFGNSKTVQPKGFVKTVKGVTSKVMDIFVEKKVTTIIDPELRTGPNFWNAQK